MKCIIILLTLITIPCVYADEKKNAIPEFKSLNDFLEWADTKLHANDYKSLMKAQINSSDSPKSQLAYIKKLDKDLGTAKLSKIFEGRHFPIDKKVFKLGGHRKELGHCHIDFKKVDGSWKLARIWHCK